MEKITTGETITLTNGHKYLVFATAFLDGKDYIYLISEDQPVEIRFAEQLIIDGKLDIRTLTDSAEKIKVFDAFKQLYAKK